MKKLLTLALLASVVLFACSKKDNDNEPEPGPGSSANIELYKKVLGKWTFDNVELGARKAATSVRTGARKAPGNTSLLNILDVAPGVSGMIEFDSDSTYYLYDGHGNYHTGTFSAKDGATISLANFGAMSGITFADGKINFKLTYSSLNKEITISANKAAPVTLDDRTKLLCRSWYLTEEEDGKDIFGESELYDVNDNYIGTFILDSVCFKVTNAGTYIVEFYDEKNVLKQAQVANWKWTTPQQNGFSYWWSSDAEDSGDVIIRELSQNLLKISETYNQSEDNWTLRLAK